MVEFYETDIHEKEYINLPQDEKDKYIKYEYYSNTHCNVWVTQYNTLEEIEKSEYTPINLYVLKPMIPLDYPFIPPSEESQLIFKRQISWSELRQARDKALTDSDWTQNKDITLNEEKNNEWIVYRQTLRDLPSMYTDETILTWQLPIPPT